MIAVAKRMHRLGAPIKLQINQAFYPIMDACRRKSLAQGCFLMEWCVMWRKTDNAFLQKYKLYIEFSYDSASIKMHVTEARFISPSLSW